MKPERHLWLLLVFAASGTLGALGATEDPQEKLTKSWNLEAVRTLEIRGEVEFEIAPGRLPLVVIETSRALFDQITVSNWWGAATVAVESGLRGPRERGVVQVRIELPSLEELSVWDQSSGRVTWPAGDQGRLRIGGNSQVRLAFEGTQLAVEASWLSSLQLKGRAALLEVTLRHESRADAREITVGEAQLALDEGSWYEAGPTGRGTGSARHGSRISLLQPGDWRTLNLREGSVLTEP